MAKDGEVRFQSAVAHELFSDALTKKQDILHSEFQSAVAHELFSDHAAAVADVAIEGFKALSRMSSSPTRLVSGEVYENVEVVFQSAVAHELFSDAAQAAPQLQSEFVTVSKRCRA